MEKIPTMANFELTTRCNLNCKMCCQKDIRANYKKEVNLNDVKHIISNLNDVKSIYFVGGETLLRKDILEVLKFLDKKGITYEISSNGKPLTKKLVEELKKLSGLKQINLSLDGLKETHNRIRRSQSSFNEVVNAIKMTKDHFNLEIVSVIMKENLKELANMLNFLTEFGISNIRFVVEMFSRFDEREETKRILGKDIKITGQVKKSSGYKSNELKDTINDILINAKENGIKVDFEPRLLVENVEKINNREIRKLKLDCRQLKQIRIDCGGNLIICEFIRNSFGNLVDSSIHELYNGDKYRLLKKKILDNNLLPICNNCCKLMLR
jgi:MoaA/NifB/PqqE/SkfB family radical SAM enzyme